jgi:hypothetical protein
VVMAPADRVEGHTHHSHERWLQKFPAWAST